MSESAVQFANSRRVHLSLGVSDIERAKPFYRELFGVEPNKTRPGYARYEVQSPPLNLSIIETPGPTGPSDATSHFGVQVKSIAAVEEMRRRFEAAGLTIINEDSVNCCHAVQDKVWVVDPDGHRWEVFVVLDDTPEVESGETVTCCFPTETEACCDTAAEPCCTEKD